MVDCYICQHPHCTKNTSDYHISICREAIKCFSAQIRDVDGVIEQSKGCTHDVAHTAFMCTQKSYDGSKVHAIHGDSAQYSFHCCDSASFCNDESSEWPDLPERPSDDLYYDYNYIDDYGESDVGSSVLSTETSVTLTLIICSFIVLVTLAVSLLFVLYKRHVDRMQRLAFTKQFYSQSSGTMQDSLLAAHSNPRLLRDPLGDSTLREFHTSDAPGAVVAGSKNEDITSGSGSGMPFLVQRTLAKQIQLSGCIGKGRYGEVWHGLWNGDSVAVKIFYSRDEMSWQRESDIYSISLLRHPNILGYIGSDFTSQNSCTQLWLVTHYHELGSLYDFLNQRRIRDFNESESMASLLSLENSCELITSALTGIVHLHSEIHGSQAKPGIAHRDIKSKNILVKLEKQYTSTSMQSTVEMKLSAIIADFGLAVTSSSSTSAPSGPRDSNGKSDNCPNQEAHKKETLGFPDNTRVGTKRYMSPEVLDWSINSNVSFESFCRSDIYSFSLVMWEILSCLSSSTYALPYSSYVGADPSFEEMYELVCFQKSRPNIQHIEDSRSKIVCGMKKLMMECWHTDPSVRLSALRLKKSVVSVINKST